MSQNDDLLNKKQWISMPNDDQATLQPRIASLEYEVIRLEAEKAELVEAAQNLCDDFGDNLETHDHHRFTLVEALRALLAKAETVETDNTQKKG